MKRLLPCVLLLLVGCVPVTTPLGDVTKAEVDQQLVGKWQRDDDKVLDEADVPVVKGHPKGLMRAVHNNLPDDPKKAFWFYTTTVGKHSYMVVYMEPKEGFDFADFREEGAFAKYTQAQEQRYFIFRYTLAGDKLVIDGGNHNRLKDAMKAANIDAAASGAFKTPDGWLAKFLATKEAEALFDGSNKQSYTRVKK